MAGNDSGAGVVICNPCVSPASSTGFTAPFLGILWKGQIYNHASLLLGFPGETRRAHISWPKTIWEARQLWAFCGLFLEEAILVIACVKWKAIRDGGKVLHGTGASSKPQGLLKMWTPECATGQRGQGGARGVCRYLWCLMWNRAWKHSHLGCVFYGLPKVLIKNSIKARQEETRMF